MCPLSLPKRRRWFAGRADSDVIGAFSSLDRILVCVTGLSFWKGDQGEEDGRGIKGRRMEGRDERLRRHLVTPLANPSRFSSCNVSYIGSLSQLEDYHYQRG